MHLALVLALVLAGVAGRLEGQEAPARPRPLMFATLGLGGGSLGFAAQLGISAHMPFGELTLRYAEVSEFNVFGPSDSVNDVALLYGYRRVKGRRWFSTTMGPALAGRKVHQCVPLPDDPYSCESYAATTQRRAGIGFQGTAGWRHVSVSALGNVNTLSSFVGATLNVHLGRVR